MYTYEEYSKLNSLVGLLTGTITGTMKYGDVSDEVKKALARQLQWCYEMADVPTSDSTKEDIERFLKS